MANELKPISNHLPSDLKGKYEIIDDMGFPLLSSGSTFKVGKFPKLDVSKLTESQLLRQIKRGHPRIVKVEDAKKLQEAASKSKT